MKKIIFALFTTILATASYALTKDDETKNEECDEEYTYFKYAPNTYYTIVNKSTGAKLGISFDYNNHASAYKDSLPDGDAPNDIVIDENKVFRFKFMPVHADLFEECYIVSENLFAMQDGSDFGHGQWLIFRYLDKRNPNQKWRLMEKDGTVTIINYATGRCVDLAGGETKEGAAVFSYEINYDPKSNANQKWVIEEAGK
jgi:hypothetical protein